MATHNISEQTPLNGRRRKLFISGLVLRMLIALIISWLIVMAFFVTGVGSH